VDLKRGVGLLSTAHENTAPKVSGDAGGTSTENQSDLVLVTVPGVLELTEQGRERYDFHITRVAKDLLKETSNLASARKAGTRRKEFHGDHVDEAFKLVAGRGLKRNPKSLWYVWGRVLQAAATLLLGIAAIYVAFPGAWAGWGYIVAVSVSVAFLLQSVLEIVDWYTSRS
jgi:hypothetical protein